MAELKFTSEGDSLNSKLPTSLFCGDDEAAVWRYERLAGDVGIGSDDRVSYAVNEKLRVRSGTVLGLALDEIVTAQMGVGHAGWDAAVVFKTNGLD